MIKKWSYVAAAMLTVASGMALTSCIDNDEPYGIEQIRLATASLLEAKKAALSAEQAAEQARIEIEKLRVEIEKAKAETEKTLAAAEAEIKLAEAAAKEKQAEADAAKTQAEADKIAAEADYYAAQAEAKRAETQMYLEEQAARIAEFKALADLGIQTAQLEYDNAVYRFEKEKADNANDVNNKLWNLVESAFYTYLAKIDDYNKANKAYAESLNTLAGINADLVWDGNQFTSPKYEKKASIEDAIARTEKQIAGYQETIDIYNEFLAKVETFKGGSAYQLLEEYKGLLEQADAARHQAALEYEQVKIDQADVYNKPEEIQAEIKEMKNEKIAIEAYTIEPIAVLGAINKAWQSPIKVVDPNTKYTLKEVEAYEAAPSTTPVDAYNAADAKYKNLILNFTLAMLDDNDVAWSQARLNEMNRQLTNNKALQEAEALWTLAKKAYNMGNNPDAAALPLASELQTAIDNYNAFGETVVAAKENYANAQEAESDAMEAYTDAMSAYQNSADANSVPGKFYQAQLAYNKALREANTNYSTAYDNATAAYNNAIDKTYLKRSQLEVALNKAVDAQLNLPANATDKQKEDAQKAVENAQKAYNNYVYAQDVYDDQGNYVSTTPSGMSQDLTAAADARDAAYAKATQTRNAARNAAQEAYNKAWDAYLAAGGNTLAEKDPAYAPVANALKAYQAAQEKTAVAQEALNKISQYDLYKLWTKMNDLADKQVKAIEKDYNYPGFVWNYQGAIPAYGVVSNFVYSSVDEEFPSAVAPINLLNEDADVPNSDWEDQVYANARWFLELASYEAYGMLGWNNSKDYDNVGYDWQKDKAFLLDEVNVDVINAYIKNMLLASGTAEEDITPFDYYNKYNLFGKYGAQAKLLLDIQFAQACIDPNANASITSVINTLKANLETLETTYNDKAQALADKQDEKKEANKAVKALDAQAQAAIEAAEEIYTIYNNIVNVGYPAPLPEGQNAQITGLQAWVDQLASGEFVYEYLVEDETTHEVIVKKLDGITAVKLAYEAQIEKEAAALATAQELLAKYQYQLAQYEAGYDVEDPEVYNAEYLKGCVEIAEEAMKLAKAHYDDLQAKYDAINKQQ